MDSKACLGALIAASLLAGCGGGSDPSTANVTETLAPSDNQSTVSADAPTSTAMAVLAPKTVATIPATTFTGRGWYVDAVGGSDSNAGTKLSPWKTLAKAAAAPLSAGDAILLKCGGTSKESLRLAGTMNKPLSKVTVGVWGTCTTDNRPVISGADPVQGVTWTLSTQFGGLPVYAARWSQPVSQLYWNGSLLTRARHPNYGGIGAEFSLVQRVKSSTSFLLSAADATKFSGVNLTGATVNVRTEPWKAEKATVSAFSGADGSVTLASAFKSPVDVGEGYFIENHKALLDAAGEWFFDVAGTTLYVYLPNGVSPSTGLLETVKRGVGLSLNSTADARVDNLQFDRHLSRSLELIDAPRTVVTDVVSKGAADTGIFVDRLSLSTGSQGTQILRATVTNAGSKGIQIGNSPSSLIDSSTITAVGLLGFSGSIGDGIQVFDSNGTAIRSNTVSGTASSAINLGRISNVSVTGNAISQGCARFTDCGAIYAWGAPGGTVRNTYQSNRIVKMVPNNEGAVGGSTSLVAAVYFDIDSGSTDVVNNMISNVGVGLMMLDASNNRFASNKVWPVDSISVRVHSSNASVDKVRGNVIENNLLFGANSLRASGTAPTTFASSSIYPQQWIHTSDASLMFSGTKPNIVRNNTTGLVTDRSDVRWVLQGGSSTSYLDSAAWSQFASGEQLSQVRDLNLVLPTYAGDELISNGAMLAPATPWSYWAAPGSVGGGATFGGCTSGCATFRSGSAQDTLSSGAFAVSGTSGSNLYLLRFKGQSMTGQAVRATVNVARNGGDWGSLGVANWVTLPGDKEITSETLFYASAADSAKLSYLSPAGQTIVLRDASLRRVSAYQLLVPQAEAALLANESSAARSIDCAASGLRTCTAMTLDGNPVVWPVVVPANSAVPIVTGDQKWISGS